MVEEATIEAILVDTTIEAVLINTDMEAILVNTDFYLDFIDSSHQFKVTVDYYLNNSLLEVPMTYDYLLQCGICWQL